MDVISTYYLCFIYRNSLLNESHFNQRDYIKKQEILYPSPFNKKSQPKERENINSGQLKKFVTQAQYTIGLPFAEAHSARASETVITLLSDVTATPSSPGSCLLSILFIVFVFICSCPFFYPPSFSIQVLPIFICFHKLADVEMASCLYGSITQLRVKSISLDGHHSTYSMQVPCPSKDLIIFMSLSMPVLP